MPGSKTVTAPPDLTPRCQRVYGLVMARRTRDRSPLSTHYRTHVGGVDVLAHKGLIRKAIADVELGCDPIEVLCALPGYALVEWATGDEVTDQEAIVAWFEWTEPDGDEWVIN